MGTQKQGFRLKSVLGIVLAVIAAFLVFFDVLPLPAIITILIVGIALIATSSAPWRAKEP